MGALIQSTSVWIGRALLSRSNSPLRCRQISKRSLSPFHRSEPLFHLRSGSIIARSKVIMSSSSESALARVPTAESLAPPPHGVEKDEHLEVGFAIQLLKRHVIYISGEYVGKSVHDAKSGARQYKIALCQLSVVADKATNIAHARERIEAAADNGAQLIVLPELWNCPYSNDNIPIYAEETDGPDSATPSSAMLADVAQKKGVTIIGGSIPERSNGRLYNSCYIFGKHGELKGKHRKVHLFDIDIPGKISFKESAVLSRGETLTVVDTDVGRIGVGICYDVRFSEMAMLYAARGVHLIAYPGAFNMTTGPLHWELLLKARAVDNQLYVAACSPARDNSAGYVAWGHSTIVGPFAEIVSTTEEKEATVFGEIDYSQIYQRRLNIPIASQRRGDLYSLVDKCHE